MCWSSSDVLLVLFTNIYDDTFGYTGKITKQVLFWIISVWLNFYGMNVFLKIIDKWIWYLIFMLTGSDYYYYLINIDSLIISQYWGLSWNTFNVWCPVQLVLTNNLFGIIESCLYYSKYTLMCLCSLVAICQWFLTLSK